MPYMASSCLGIHDKHKTHAPARQQPRHTYLTREKRTTFCLLTLLGTTSATIVATKSDDYNNHCGHCVIGG